MGSAFEDATTLANVPCLAGSTFEIGARMEPLSPVPASTPTCILLVEAAPRLVGRCTGGETDCSRPGLIWGTARV